MSLEHYLVSYCAPTLASLKTANLFRLPWGQEKAGAAEKLGYTNYWAARAADSMQLPVFPCRTENRRFS